MPTTKTSTPETPTAKAPTTKTSPAEAATIKNRIAKLNEEVEWFYGDDFSLDEAVEKYETTLAHAKAIQKDLEELKNKIVKIEEDFTKE